MDDRSEVHIKLLALTVFGWMPTILDCDNYETTEVIAAINYFSEYNPIDTEEAEAEAINHFTALATMLKNSYVGASKFLHALWPDRFAILDSNVSHALNGLCHDANITINGSNVFLASDTVSVERLIVYELAIREAAQMADLSLREIEQRLFLSGRTAIP